MDKQIDGRDKQSIHRALCVRLEEARRNRATALNLSDQGLTQVPAALEQLTHLQALDLSCNQLTTVPEVFCFGKHLLNSRPHLCTVAHGH